MGVEVLHSDIIRVRVRLQDIMTGTDNPFSVSDVELEEVSADDDENDSFDESIQSEESSCYVSELEDERGENEVDNDIYTSTPLTHYTDATYDVRNVRRRLFTSFEISEVMYCLFKNNFEKN